MEPFRTPGLVDDVAGKTPPERETFAFGWDSVVSSWMDFFSILSTGEGGRFYNPRFAPTADAQTARVPWDAFPRAITKWFEDDAEPDLARWKAAETLRPLVVGGKPLRRRDDGSEEPVVVFYRQQDEYCEWFAHRDGDGHITRVTFTCESPEYWRFLAHGTEAFFQRSDLRARMVPGDLDLVAQLYRTHVDPSVTLDDLLWPYDVEAWNAGAERWQHFARAGTYNPFNKWNTTHGAMHLTHPANTLVGEFVVAARAAVLRQDSSGTPIDAGEAVVCCSGFGDANRASDPAIGAVVNGLVKDGYWVSLADPVGLYLARPDPGPFRGPQGEELPDVWHVDRGSADGEMVLRATFAAPPGAAYMVSDILAAGVPIAYGGQIADSVQMTLAGLAEKRGSEPAARMGCVAKCCRHPEKPEVETVIGVDGNCADVEWSDLEPISSPDGQRRPARRVALQPEAGLAAGERVGARPEGAAPRLLNRDSPGRG